MEPFTQGEVQKIKRRKAIGCYQKSLGAKENPLEVKRKCDKPRRSISKKTSSKRSHRTRVKIQGGADPERRQNIPKRLEPKGNNNDNGGEKRNISEKFPESHQRNHIDTFYVSPLRNLDLLSILSNFHLDL